MLKRFENLMDRYPMDRYPTCIPKQVALDFLTVENRRLDQILQSEGRLSVEDAEACEVAFRMTLVFYEFGFYDTMTSRFPAVMEGMYQYVEFINDRSIVTEEQWEWIHTLRDYIFRVDADRKCRTFWKNGNHDAQFLPRVISGRHREEAREEVEKMIMAAMKATGLLLLIWPSGTPGETIANGFDLSPVGFSKMDEERLRACLRALEKDSERPDRRYICQIADLDLPMTPPE